MLQTGHEIVCHHAVNVKIDGIVADAVATRIDMLKHGQTAFRRRRGGKQNRSNKGKR
jgi:hypothetical protein